MKERWIWLVRYAVVIVLALVLAAALGEMDLFKTTKFGKSGLNAARLVQFLGFGSALAVLWLAAQRAAALLPAGDERCSRVGREFPNTLPAARVAHSFLAARGLARGGASPCNRRTS